MLSSDSSLQLLTSIIKILCIWYFWKLGFLFSSRLVTSAFLNGFVSEIERKQKSQYLIEEIFAFGKEPFIAREPLTAIKEDERELLVLMCITNK